MIQKVTFTMFRDAFKKYCGDDFSYQGLRALFNYLEQADSKYELDVMELHAIYSEYESVEALLKSCPDIKEPSLEYLREFTTVIECSNGHVIIKEFI